MVIFLRLMVAMLAVVSITACSKKAEDKLPL